MVPILSPQEDMFLQIIHLQATKIEEEPEHDSFIYPNNEEGEEEVPGFATTPPDL